MKKFSSAIVMTAVSMLAQQAHASESIDIDTSKVDDSMCKNISQHLKRSEIRPILYSSANDFAQNIKVNGKANKIVIKTHMANIDDVADSTSIDSNNLTFSQAGNSGYSQCYSQCYAKCYSKCYSNCHGSRSWR